MLYQTNKGRPEIDFLGFFPQHPIPYEPKRPTFLNSERNSTFSFQTNWKLYIRWFYFWAQFALLLLYPVLPFTDAKSCAKVLPFRFPEMGSLPSDESFRLRFNLVSSTLLSVFQELPPTPC